MMIITIKTLQQKSFKVEIDESETVGALKKKIEEEQGSGFPASGLKLIYAGKILSDASPISEYKIVESSFVVVMISKIKAQPPKETATSVPASTTASTPTSTSVSTPAQHTTTSGQTSATPQQTSTSETEQPQALAENTTPSNAPTVTLAATGGTESTDRGGSDLSQASSLLVTGSDYEQVILNLMAMGYDRDNAVRAMQASFNNPDRAAEYLLTAIPDTVDTVPDTVYERPPPSESQASTNIPQSSHPISAGLQSGSNIPPSSSEEEMATAAVGSEEEPSATGEENPLEFLRDQPQFNRLRATIRNNPTMLQGLLQQIGHSNPALLDLISQNQQAFIDLLNSNNPPSSDQVPPLGLPVDFDSQREAQGSSGPPAPQGPPGGPHVIGTPVSIQVTSQEKEVIDRLKAMGFPEHLVVQAYFACEKNEELTMEFLLNQDPNDD